MMKCFETNTDVNKWGIQPKAITGKITNIIWLQWGALQN